MKKFFQAVILLLLTGGLAFTAASWEKYSEPEKLSLEQFTSLEYQIYPVNGGPEKVIHTFDEDELVPAEEYPELVAYYADYARELAEYKRELSQAEDAEYVLRPLPVEIAEYDFNNDQLTDYLIRRWMGMGKNQSDFTLLLNRGNERFTEVEIARSREIMSVMQSMTNGLYDISFNYDDFHHLLTYDGEKSYHYEEPAPLQLADLMGGGGDRITVADGRLSLNGIMALIRGDVPRHQPFYIGIKLNLPEEFKRQLKTPILWACDGEGNMIPFTWEDVQYGNRANRYYEWIFMVDLFGDAKSNAELEKYMAEIDYWPVADYLFAYLPD